MPTHDVWLVLPTANADNCARTLPAWRDMGYRIAVLQDTRRFDCEADAIVHAPAYPGWPATVNHLFREVVPETTRVIVAAGDDMFPDPTLRAGELAEQFLERFPDTFGVMQPHGDRFEETQQFCGSPWLGRAWMERMYAGRGGMCDAYTHHWADDELYWVSRCLGALWSRDDVSQYHDHFRRTGAEMPEYWRQSVHANDARDTLTFIARAASGFPGCEPAWPAGSAAPRFDRDLFRSEYKGRAETYWRTHHAAQPQRSEAEARIEAALQRCAELGLRRVALFGAGRHTRKAAAALAQPPVEVAAILDENPDLGGTRLWNFPVWGVALAAAKGLDAVVLSSDAMEPALRAAAEPLRAAGAAVVGLYPELTVTPPARAARAG